MGTIANRLKQDLERAKLAQSTREDYFADAKALVKHFRRPPAELSQDDLRDYLTDLEHRPIGVSRRQRHLAAIKFLYCITLGQPEKVAWIRFPSPPRKLPTILTRDQVKALLAALKLPVLRAIVMVLYAAGLRISEACALKIADIHADRMVIHVVGKGGRERLAVLSPALLRELRIYWSAERPPKPYLFANKLSKLGRPVSADKVQKAVGIAARIAGIKTRVTPHLLRHSFATHLHEAGTALSVIQHLLGHAHIQTTIRYVQISTRMLQAVKSPFDSIDVSPV